MGVLGFLFGGGNVGLVAQSLSYHHHRLGSFDEVKMIYLADFQSRANGSRNYSKARIAARFLEDGQMIRNYSDLAALALYVDAAPANADYTEVRQMMKASIDKQLKKRGISETTV